MPATTDWSILFIVLVALFVAVCAALVWLWTYNALRWLVRPGVRRARVLDAQAPPSGFPVLAAVPVQVPAGPPEGQGGTFRIVGVDRATGGDVDLLIPAATVANAHVKAELRGIVVTEVTRVAAGEQPAAV